MCYKGSIYKGIIDFLQKLIHACKIELLDYYFDLVGHRIIYHKGHLEGLKRLMS